VGVLIADVDGRICQATEEASRILNTADASDADAYGEVLGWWDSAGRLLKQGPLARALQEGISSHSERLEIRRFNGSHKTIVVSAAPLSGLDARRVTSLVSFGVELEESAAP
jgi:hypothetical protein